MRLTLVQPPNGLFDRYDLAPPLGLLTVAAAAECDGVEVSLVDMNLRGLLDHDWVQADFYTNAVAAIAATEPDVVGFTSMSVESHVCLELARRLKAADPAVITVFGGPHFSAIAAESLELYSWVDYVVTGEGERATVDLLRRLRGRAPAAEPANVASRNGGGVRLRREHKPLGTLDDLPFPAYHLVDLGRYFEANPMRLLDFEHGRGCIFKCSFCYSPVHWGQGEQTKRVESVVAEVQRLWHLGARHLFFVQDNFPNSKAHASAVCNALAEAGGGMTWNCYATLPHLLPTFLDELAAAGCRSVFVGVDAITTSSQRAFSKPFFRGWEKLSEQLEGCLSRGIVPTCAFMIDIPENGCAGTDAALTTALMARNLGCGIRLNTLTLYNRTASAVALGERQRTYTEIKTRLLLDTPDVLHDNPYAREHPELFPFHQTFLEPELYERFVSGMHFAYTLFTAFPRTLLQWVLVDGGSLWGLLDGLAAKVGDLVRIDPTLRRPVERELFQHEFPRRSLSRQTRAALEMETAELRLGRIEPEARVRVGGNGRAEPHTLTPHRLLRLPYRPEAFDRVEGLPEPGAIETPYLLVRQGRDIEYFEVDDEVVETLGRLEGASRTGTRVEVPAGLLDQLVQAGVLDRASAQ